MKPVTVLALLSPLLLSGCLGSGAHPLQGYVEGTYVYVSPDATGRIVELAVDGGTPVAAGALLFRLDDSDQKEAVAAAEARLAEAEAQLDNLRSGKRNEEIAVLQAQLAQGQAELNSAGDDYKRQIALRERQVVAQSAVDEAKRRLDTAQAIVDAANRQLDVAKLPARPGEITAAERNVAAQQAMLAQAKTGLERRILKAPASALVEETFFEPGELVSAGQPVVSLLPDANKKARFFLPEPSLAGVKIGDPVAISCDGCAAGLGGTVTFIATEAEFTPPVIYSREAREKLVYRVEAKLLGEAARLKVGQPIDVRIGPATGS